MMPSPENRKVLTKEQVDQFLRHGVLVVENVLTPSELESATNGLTATLAEHGIDTQNLKGTGHELGALSSTNGSGGVLDLFYPEWKMQVANNPRLFHATCQLWEAAYCHQGETLDELDDSLAFKWHPYGPFDCQRGYAYVDRIGYRIPTELAEQLGSQSKGTKAKKAKPIQRSLTPHLDCCPETLFSNTASKWRPIQCFVSLTDNLEPNTGGFEAAPGFHREFHRWSRPETLVVRKTNGRREQISVPAPCIGEYTHIRPQEDSDIMTRIQHIPVRAGSAVFWDNRIPHANAYRNNSSKARAVVYCSFLPDVELNREYVRRQLWNYRHRVPPSDQWINSTAAIESRLPEKGDDTEQLAPSESELSRKLLGIDPW